MIHSKHEFSPSDRQFGCSQVLSIAILKTSIIKLQFPSFFPLETGQSFSSPDRPNMSPPILHPLFPVLEPIMQMFVAVSEIKPPPRPASPEEVSAVSHSPRHNPCHVPDGVSPKTKTGATTADTVTVDEVVPRRAASPSGSGEEVTSPRPLLARLVLEGATEARFPYDYEPYLFLRRPLSWTDSHPASLRWDMAPPPRPAATTAPKGQKSEYISTDTGNKVARRSQLHGTQHIILGGRAVIQPQVCIRGDLTRLPHPPATPSTASTTQGQAQPQTQTQTQTQTQNQPSVSVSIGRYSFISSTAVLRPPWKLLRGILTYSALRVGEHVFVGPGAVVEAASIGDRAVIGEGSVVGRFAILKEGCMVLAGAVVPAGMVVPSGAVVGGRPARLVGELGDGWEGVDLREMWRATG